MFEDSLLESSGQMRAKKGATVLISTVVHVVGACNSARRPVGSAPDTDRGAAPEGDGGDEGDHQDGDGGGRADAGRAAVEAAVAAFALGTVPLIAVDFAVFAFASAMTAFVSGDVSRVAALANVVSPARPPPGRSLHGPQPAPCSA